ncbi:rod shape-determining protein RodA, partial [Patescibacteria group bacterium]|nr:rod shape-determining protein RodA [Patescibacteria group bacterium]
TSKRRIWCHKVFLMLCQMSKTSPLLKLDGILIFSIGVLVLIGTIVLRSIMPSLFPNYYIYPLLAFLVFYVFKKIDFDIFTAFAPHLYFISILLLSLPLIIGQVTRGAIRWIPIGPIAIQPSEIVRPFLFLFFAKYLTSQKPDFKRSLKLIGLISIPLFLIVVQPSLGVTTLTAIGFLGVLLASNVDKKFFLTAGLLVLALLPLFWLILAPYQKLRVLTFLDPMSDRYGAGYNSAQSMIAVGSGKFTGRGLGEGVQTQLKFLPEKHTDFIFASIAEELGFVGNVLVLVGECIVFWCLIAIIEQAKNPTARAYVAGVFLVLFAETFVHAGMNMGLLPITGVPLPFVSAGGSALMGTMMAIGIALNAKKVAKTCF